MPGFLLLLCFFPDIWSHSVAQAALELEMNPYISLLNVLIICLRHYVLIPLYHLIIFFITFKSFQPSGKLTLAKGVIWPLIFKKQSLSY